MRGLHLKRLIIILLVLFPVMFIYAGNPAAPIQPADNIQDPGDPGTPWGGCGPTDPNCYVTFDTSAFFANGGNSFAALATLGTNDNNALVFETNNIEAAQFNTAQELLIGSSTDNGTYLLQVAGNIWTSGTFTFSNAPTTSAGTYDLLTRNTATGIIEKMPSSTFLTGNQTITLSGDVSGSGTTAITTTIAADSVALTTDTTGNYVATITAGNGISGASSTEGGTPTIALSALTADWNQTGAFNISLNNAGAGLKMLENGATPTFFGIFDVADLTTADKTYTFPNASGTVITTGNITDITGLTDSQISDTLTSSIFIGTGSTTNAIDLATTEVAGTLPVGNGGTGATSLTDLIALGANTTGNYVATITAGNGISGSSSIEGGTPTLALNILNSLDGTGATTSESGFEFAGGSSNQLALLQGCADNQILKWNDGLGTWGCSNDAFGGGAGNSFETISTPAGTNPVADSSTDTLTLTATGTNLTITGNATTDSIDLDISETALAGAGLAANSSALDVTPGNGIQIASDAVALGTLTADWNQTGAFSISLNNVSAGLKMLENGATPTFFGIFDVADLTTADKTYTFPNASGTVITTGNLSDITGFANTALSNLSSVAINTSLLPGVNDGAALGSGTLSFSDLFLASGGVINFANGDTTLTQATGYLTLNNKLGIATSGTPVDPLQVNGGIRVQGSSTRTALAGSVTIDFVGGSSSARIESWGGNTSTRGGFTFRQSASDGTLGQEPFSIDSAGKLTIGTNTNATQFVVNGGNASTTIGQIALTNAGTQTFYLGTGNGGGYFYIVNQDITLQQNGSGAINLISAGGSINLTGNLLPATTDTVQLGSTTKMFSDLFLASGAVVNFNNGDVTLTHAADTLTLAGGVFTVNADGLGTTQSATNGLSLTNNTAAAVGAQQISPAIVWTGQGWKTDATAASQPVSFRSDILPVQGTANPSGIWQLAASINGGAYGNVLTVTSGGAVAATGAITGSNLSGTNTGDQTITLTGDVTGTGTGSFATTIAADSVALTTDTTGNYVAGATANSGLTMTGTEGGTLGIALTSSGTTGSTASNSGLEVGTAGLTLLKGCADNEILKYTDAGGWACAADATGGAGSPAMSAITAAIATNTINNAGFAQEWQWNTLAGATGLKLSSTSTAAATNLQKLFEVSLSGANATASQTTYGAYLSNTHTGTSSSNVALYATASGGTSNYAAIFDQGNVGIGGTTPLANLDIVRSTDALVDPTVVSNYQLALRATDNTNNTGLGIVFSNSSSNTPGAAIIHQREGASSYGTLQFYTRNSGGTFGERMRIANNGNVGIGTTNPTHNLTLGSTANDIAIYNTTDQTTNYERGIIGWTAGGIFQIGEESAGTGTNRALLLYSENNIGVQTTLELDRHIAPFFVLDTSSTTLSGNWFQIQGSAQTAAGSDVVIFDVAPTINQSSTAAFTALRVSPYLQTTGSGRKNLFDVGTNSAAAGGGTHTSLFNIDSSGYIQSTGRMSLTSANTTQTTTSSILALNGNSLTSGTGLYAASSTLSSGSLVNFSVNSTAAASDTQKVLNITTAGANGTVGMTTYGATISNTHTGTSSTNIGLSVTASGGTGNRAIIVPSGGGRVGIGTSSPSYLLDVVESSTGFAPAINIANSDASTTSYAQIAFSGSGRTFGVGVGNSTETVNNVASKFFIYDATTNAVRMVVDTGGAVGIGDTTPNSLLTVGTNDAFQVSATGAIVATTGIASSGNYVQSAGTMSLTSANTTQTTTSSILALNGNSLTSGTGLYAASSTLSSGSLVNLSVTGTAAASNAQKVLNITTSGANATASQTTYGAYISNSHSAATGTNVGLYVNANGTGGLVNYAAIFDQGRVGIGITDPVTSLDIVRPSVDPLNSPDTITNWTLTLRKTGNENGFGVGIGFGDSSSNIVGAGIVHTREGTNSYGYLSFLTRNSGGTMAERMRISNEGYVGIGSFTTPTYLNIGGSLTATANNQVGGLSVSTSITGRATVSDTVYGVKLAPSLTAGANSQSLVGLLVAPTYNDNTKTGVVHYDAIFNGGGNVGIGTATPGAPLEVYSTTNSATLFKTVATADLNTINNTYGVTVVGKNTWNPIGNPVQYPYIIIGDSTQGAGTYGIGLETKNTVYNIPTITLGFTGSGGALDMWNYRSWQPSGSYGMKFTTSDGAGSPNAMDRLTISGNTATAIVSFTNSTVGIGTTSSNTKLQILSTALGTTQDDTKGIQLLNNTAAAAGAQQISPAFVWTGQGWKTDATAASQAVAFRSYVVPVQGTANPSGYLTFESSINGGAYANKFTITSGGNVGIGNTAPSIMLHVGSSSVTDGTALLRLEDANSTCDFNANTGSPSCGSDATLKKDITPLDTNDLLVRVSALNPVSYRWLTDPADSKVQYGFIAQEVEAQFPDLVSEHMWIDGTQRKFLNMGGLVPYLAGALKALDVKVADIESLHADTFLESLRSWLGSSDNGIESFYAHSILANQITAQETICVGSTCLTESQLQQLIQNAGNNSSQGGTTNTTSEQPTSGNTSNSGDQTSQGDTTNTTPEQPTSGNTVTPSDQTTTTGSSTTSEQQSNTPTETTSETTPSTSPSV